MFCRLSVLLVAALLPLAASAQANKGAAWQVNFNDPNNRDTVRLSLDAQLKVAETAEVSVDAWGSPNFKL